MCKNAHLSMNFPVKNYRHAVCQFCLPVGAFALVCLADPLSMARVVARTVPATFVSMVYEIGETRFPRAVSAWANALWPAPPSARVFLFWY